MDWSFFRNLFIGIFYNSHHIILSLPTYFGILSYIILLFPKLGGKMKDKLLKVRKYALSILMGFILISVILTSHSLYKNKRLKFATPDELTAPLLQNMSIRISDLAREDFTIRNKAFYNCHIYGPAIIFPSGCTFFNLSLVEVASNGCLVETTNKIISGAIGLENCVIRDCIFHKISFIGPPKMINEIREQLNIKK